jgi:hypothetical protein
MAGQAEQQSDPVVAAIERVLRTEREGVELLRESAEDAQRLLMQTRAQAAALARRADRCIAKLHTAYLQKIERQIRQLTASESADGDDAGRSYDTAALAEAARRVAAKLTGGA